MKRRNMIVRSLLLTGCTLAALLLASAPPDLCGVAFINMLKPVSLADTGFVAKKTAPGTFWVSGAVPYAMQSASARAAARRPRKPPCRRGSRDLRS